MIYKEAAKAQLKAWIAFCLVLDSRAVLRWIVVLDSRAVVL